MECTSPDADALFRSPDTATHTKRQSDGRYSHQPANMNGGIKYGIAGLKPDDETGNVRVLRIRMVTTASMYGRSQEREGLQGIRV